jgi:hypothetical protein
MNLGRNPGSSMFGGQWNQQGSNQRGSQFSAPSTSFAWVDDAMDQPTSYSFDQPFDLRHFSNETPQSVLTPLNVTFASTTQLAPNGSSTGVRLPPLQGFPGAGSSQSTQSHQRTTPPPAKPKNLNGRISAATFSQADWEKHRGELKRLWVDEDKPLNVTMKVMEEEFGFGPS